MILFFNFQIFIEISIYFVYYYKTFGIKNFSINEFFRVSRLRPRKNAFSNLY